MRLRALFNFYILSRRIYPSPSFTRPYVQDSFVSPPQGTLLLRSHTNTSIVRHRHEHLREEEQEEEGRRRKKNREEEEGRRRRKKKKKEKKRKGEQEEEEERQYARRPRSGGIHVHEDEWQYTRQKNILGQDEMHNERQDGEAYSRFALLPIGFPNRSWSDTARMPPPRPRSPIVAARHGKPSSRRCRILTVLWISAAVWSTHPPTEVPSHQSRPTSAGTHGGVLQCRCTRRPLEADTSTTEPRTPPSNSEPLQGRRRQTAAKHAQEA